MKRILIVVTAILTVTSSILPVMLAKGAEGPLESVSIDPVSALVATGGTQQFTAVSKDADNQTVSNVTYNWSVISGGGTINATSGLFTAGNESGTFNGTIEVTAVQGNVTKVVNATVIVAVPGQLVTLEITPLSALVPTSGTRQFTAIAKDAFGQNSSGVNYTWEVTNGGGTVDNATGLFTAGNTRGTYNGTVTVTAVQGNITNTANASVTVAVPGQLVSLAVSPTSVTLPVNGTQQFTALVKDAFDQNATGVNLTWSVVAGGGTVNSTSGLFTAGNTTGTFNDTVVVTAVQGNVTLTAAADVTLGIAGVLDHLVISPNNATVTVNGTRQFKAVAKDVFNNNVPNATYTWSVVAGGGTINATSGLFTAGNATGTFNGTVEVTVTAGNTTRIANATITVVAGSSEQKHTPPGFSKGKKKGWDGKNTPPGWEHGKKKGWNGQSVLPGLTKHEDGNKGEQEAEHANRGKAKAAEQAGIHKETG